MLVVIVMMVGIVVTVMMVGIDGGGSGGCDVTSLDVNSLRDWPLVIDNGVVVVVVDDGGDVIFVVDGGCDGGGGWWWWLTMVAMTEVKISTPVLCWYTARPGCRGFLPFSIPVPWSLVSKQLPFEFSDLQAFIFGSPGSSFMVSPVKCSSFSRPSIAKRTKLHPFQIILSIQLVRINSYDHSVQAIVWFLARWSATYLMPPAENKGNASSDNHKGKHHKKVLLDFCEVDNQGKAVLDIIINIAMTIFISYPGEKDLQGEKAIIGSSYTEIQLWEGEETHEENLKRMMNFNDIEPLQVDEPISEKATNGKATLWIHFNVIKLGKKHGFVRELWWELAAIRSLCDGPWLLCGGFNITRYPEERTNCQRFNGFMVEFSDWINDMELVDPP
ncbi:hypothetical protein FXO38_15444 [Capsicum annuum]|nr:hypothetical protein FXO38_15444 [Capsicum annuum]